VAAPLFEEWLFRGLLYRALRRNWSVGLSVAVTALLFASIHPFAGCAAILTLGTVTALAAEKTGRLWPSVVIHTGYNLTIWAVWIA
jgi:membrane protease YdiL (CAAX protease family)